MAEAKELDNKDDDISYVKTVKKKIPLKALKSTAFLSLKSIEQKNETIICDDDGKQNDRRYKVNKIDTYLKCNDGRDVNVDLSKYIVQLKMEMDDGKYYNGSGVIINIKDNIVYILTAAHNIAKFDHVYQDKITPYGIYCNINNKWYYTETFNEYYKYKPNNLEKNDLGIIKVYIDDIDFMFYNVFPKLISKEDVMNDPNCVLNNECFLYGYPGDNKNRLGQLWGMNGNYHFMSMCDNETIYYNNIDTSGGQSGSPIFIYNNNILAIHSMGDDMNNSRNYGTVLNNDKINWIHNIFDKNNDSNSYNNFNQYALLKIDETNGKHTWKHSFAVYDTSFGKFFDECTYLRDNCGSYFGIEKRSFYAFGQNDNTTEWIDTKI